MGIFYDSHKSLRTGWKVVRATVLWVLLAIVLSVILSLIRAETLSDFVPHACLILAVLLCLRLDRRGLRDVGLFVHPRWLGDFLSGMVWGAVWVILAVAGMVWITRELDTGVFFQDIHPAAVAEALLFWLLVAVGEEILFRGYVISTLRSSLNTPFSLLAAAGLFTLVHVINPEYYWFAFIYAFLLGLLLGVVFVWKSSLWKVIGFHFAWNLLQSSTVFNTPAQGGEIVYLVILGINLVVLCCSSWLGLRIYPKNVV